MDRERLDRWLEHGILSLVCLILVIAPFLFGSTRSIDFSYVQGLTALALGVWMVRFWVRDEYRVLWPPFAWAVLAFAAYVCWRYTQADVEYVARMEMNRILVYAALFFIILDNFNNKEWTRVIICTLIFVGMAASMYAIYQYTTGSRMIYNTPQPAVYWHRAGGPFVCPNHLADYVAMVLPLAFALTMMARMNIILKILICYAGIVMLAGAFVTVSRAGIAAVALGLISMFGFLMWKRDFRLKAIVAIAVILVPAIWLSTRSAPIQERFRSGMGAQGYGNDRFLLWPTAIDMWRANYWTGVGPAHFDLRYRFYRPMLAQFQARPEYVHNDYLNTLADYGIVGFALMVVGLGLFWLGVVQIWRYVRRSNDIGSKQSTRAAIVLGACSGILAVMAHSFFDFNIHIPALAIAAVTLLAVVTAQWRFATDRFWFRPGIAGRALGSLACAALAAWLGFNAVRTFREQRLVLRGERTKDGETYRALYKAAFAIDPKNPATAYEVGASLRTHSWTAGPDYQKSAEEAIEWFKKSIALDPYTPHPFIGVGMCLDWLDRKKEAWPYFRKAVELDRNNYWVAATYAWHWMQFEDWRHAQHWFLVSLSVKPNDNPMARSYFDIVNRKLVESGQPIQPPTVTPAHAQK